MAEATQTDAHLTPAWQGGMRVFLIIWTGQLVSLLGTGMTRFALLIWAYQQTGSATTVALLGFFSLLPFVLAAPIAGVVVDRVDRRLVMIGADLTAGVMTITLLILHSQGALEVWHLFVAGLVSGLAETFQNPAYSAGTTMLVSPAQYSRVNGLRSLADSASQVGAPILGGLLLVWLGLGGVLWVDVATFLIAVVSLLVVRIPMPRRESEAADTRSRRSDLVFGLRYIWARPGLVALLVVFMGMNLFGTLTYFAILPAMVLARGGGELGWASVQMALGLGGIVGSVLASTWGGPRRRIHAIYGGAALSFLLGDWLLALGQTVPVWVVGAFLGSFFIPLIMANDGAIWQAKVMPALQGRVFAARAMLRTSTMPLGYLLAGPLADQVFEPLMAGPSRVAAFFGPYLGTGPGTGIALMFLGTGLLGALMSLSGYLWPQARRVEEDLPDHYASSS